MLEHNIESYYVPKHDQYFGEYNQPHDEILHFISGFSGSAGHALMTQHHAYLFVDGRYTLQAEKEVDKKYWTIQAIEKNPLFQFLKEKQIGSIGFDPWLMTTDQVEKIKSQQIRVCPIEEDVFSMLWENRPQLQYHPIFLYDMQYAGESHASKIEKIQKNLETPYLVLKPDQICWLLNIRGEDVLYSPLVHAKAIIPITGSVELFLDPLHGALDQHFGSVVKIYPKDSFITRLKRHKKVLCKNAPYAIAAITKVVNSTDYIEPLKAIKNKTEQDNIKKAHVMDAFAVTQAIKKIKEKKDLLCEMDVDFILLNERKKFPTFKYPSFPTIAGSGPNGAIIHYRADQESNRRLSDNILLIDSGGQYLEGTTDITRTIAINPPSQEEKEAYTRVLKGNIALSRCRFPKGVTGAQIDVLARQFLWEVGIDYQHGTGHGVGCFLNVHEGPQSISRNSLVQLEAGMILSNEPGFYKKDYFGIRIENLMLVIESSYEGFLEFETLTLVPFDQDLIDDSLLTLAEKEWIEAYHNKCHAVIES